MDQDDQSDREQPSFKCPECGNAFDTQQLLDDHMIVDHGVKDP